MTASTRKPKWIYNQPEKVDSNTSRNADDTEENHWGNCFRVAIGPQNIAVSRFHTQSRHSNIDVLSRDSHKPIFNQIFEPPNYSKRMHVSFVDETLVTCGDGEIKCMAARNRELFFGFFHSGKIDVYDSILGELRKTVIVNSIEPNNWPNDMAVTSDKIFICTSLGRAIAFSENEGKFMFEYFNISTSNSKALSVTVNEKFQIVCVLWSSGQICIYSLQHNNCYLIFQISGITNIRIADDGHLYLLNEDGVQCIHMSEVLVYDHAKITLPYLLTEEELSLLEETGGISYKNIPRHKLELLLGLLQHSDLGCMNVFELLVRDNYLSKLRRPLNHYWIKRGIARSALAENQPQPIFRDSLMLSIDFQEKWFVNDFSLNRHILAVSWRKSKRQTALVIYKIENVEGNHLFLPLHEPINDKKAFGSSVRSISLIDATTVAICCNNAITVYDFEERKHKNDVSLDDIITCMAVDGENVFVGFKNKNFIDVLDFDLRLTKKIVLQGLQDMWPHHLMASCDTLSVCASSENNSKALSFERKDGRLLAEYVNLLGYEYQPKCVMLSGEPRNLVGISWMKPTCKDNGIDGDDDDEEDDNDDDDDDDGGDISEEGAVSFHSLANGHCVALVNNPQYFSQHISSFRTGKGEEKMMFLDHRGNVNIHSEEFFYSTECWKTTMSFLVPFSEWEAIRKYYKLTENECDDSPQPYYLNHQQRRVHGLLAILQEKRHINFESVDALDEVFNELFKFHLHALRSPFLAVFYPQDITADFKPPLYNQCFSKTVVDGVRSPTVRKDSSDALALTAHGESTTHSSIDPSPNGPCPNFEDLLELIAPSWLESPYHISNHPEVLPQESEERTASSSGIDPSPNEPCPNFEDLLELIAPSWLESPYHISNHPEVLPQESEERTASSSGVNQNPIEHSELQIYLDSVADSDIAKKNEGATSSTFCQGPVQSDFQISSPCSISKQSSEHIQKGYPNRKHKVECSFPNPTDTQEFSKRAKVCENAGIFNPYSISTGQMQTCSSSILTVPNELEETNCLPVELTHHRDFQLSDSAKESQNDVVGISRPYRFPSHSIPLDMGRTTDPNLTTSSMTENLFLPTSQSMQDHNISTDETLGIMSNTSHLPNQRISNSVLVCHDLDPKLVYSMDHQASAGVQQGNLLYSNLMEKKTNNLPETGSTAHVASGTYYAEQEPAGGSMGDVKHLSQTFSTSGQQTAEAFSDNFCQNGLSSKASTWQVTQCKQSSGNISEVPESWNRLPGYLQRNLLAYRGTPHGRKNVAFLVMQYFVTHEERLKQNTSGKKLRKISDEKLQMIKEITFFICPSSPSMMHEEWANICKAIDKCNRHYREKIKRREKRK